MEFEDFFNAFDGGEPAAAEEAPEVEETVDTEEPAREEPETEAAEDTPEAAAEESEGGEDGAKEEPAGDDGAQNQTFTVRIGEEDHEYSLEEMTELARKGAGYDGLQAQLEESQRAREQLQAQIDGQQGVMDILNQIAEKSDKSVQELATQMYINFRKAAGASEDAAALELENAQLKKQAEASKPPQQKTEDAAQERARREFSEFRQLFPDAKLDDATVAKLKPDVSKGMTLANAYQKMLNEQEAARLAEVARKAQAKEQNEKNRTSSPGSQQDSGGRRAKSSFDDFFAQFN